MSGDAAMPWNPPEYDLKRPPSLLDTVPSLSDETFRQNFARSARWCPDGTAMLLQYENRTLQIRDVPNLSTGSELSGPSRAFRQAAPILDYAWYPMASTANPASFCFAASVRECPVKLLDGNDGRLRASYKIVDHRERQVAPHSLAFTPMGDKLYCGFEDAIEEFDVSSPGEGTRLSTTPSKKTKEGLKGIIASIALQPSYAPLMAAGSLAPATVLAPNIALLTPEAQGQPFAFCSAPGVRAGASQLAFDPVRHHLLYATFRRHEGVYAWDIRSDTSVPVRVMMTGVSTTNQRSRFSVDIAGRWLGVGDQTGYVSVFDLSEREPPMTDSIADGQATAPAAADPALRFKAHDDAIGSVDFHPLKPVMLSVSGSRHWDAVSDDVADSSDSEDDSDHSSAANPPNHSTSKLTRGPTAHDSTIKLWGMYADNNAEDS